MAVFLECLLDQVKAEFWSSKLYNLFLKKRSKKVLVNGIISILLAIRYKKLKSNIENILQYISNISIHSIFSLIILEGLRATELHCSIFFKDA
jgi:3-deoxy-D-manno-octulosonic-acid transferase